jgi:uncharacterized membrane protein YfcA
MIELNLINIVGIIFAGLLIGFLSGALGVGGGFLMTPILRIIFGIPYNLAVGSGLIAITFTSLYGAFRHYKLQHTNIKLGIITLIGMFPGVEIGARILNELKSNSTTMDIVLNLCYLILLSLAGFIMLIEYLKWLKENKAPVDLCNYKINYYFFSKEKDLNSINIFFLSLCGFFIGILQGLLGVGGGFILIPILVYTFHIPAAIVVGTSLFIISPSSAFGGISHIFKGNVNFILVLLILSGSLIGSFVGSQLTEKIRGKKIRLYFIFVILLGIIMILLKIK